MTPTEDSPDDDQIGCDRIERELLSRTGTGSPMGTLIDDLKTKVDPDTGAKFRRMVNEVDMDTSGALRDWVYMLVHGKTYTEICMDALKVKRKALFGTGPIGATLGITTTTESRNTSLESLATTKSAA